jgi:hypothetical protein
MIFAQNSHRVINFLKINGWHDIRANGKFIFFKPPSQLGFDESYYLPVPILENALDYEKSLNFTLKTISGIYEKEPGQLFFDVENYMEILRSNALYFKIESNAVKYRHTLELSYIWNFLKNLSTSYEEFIKARFKVLFSMEFNHNSSRLDNAFKKFINLSRLRLVDLQYKSFSFGVSTDTLMENEKIEIAKVKDWRKNVLSEYKSEIININYKSNDDVEKIRSSFSEEERRKIFKPLFESINNDEYSVSITDKNFKPKLKLNRVPESTMKLIIPLKDSETSEKNLELVQIFAVIDTKNPHLTIKSKDLENDLFTEKLDKTTRSLSRIQKGEDVLSFKENIHFEISLDDSHQKVKIQFNELPNLILLVESFEQINSAISDAIFKYYDYYKHLKSKGSLLDEQERQIIYFFDTNLN